MRHALFRMVGMVVVIVLISLVTLVIVDRALGATLGPVVRPVNQLGMERRTNPVGTQLQPGFSGRYVTAEFATEIRVNSMGLRGPEIPQQRPSGTMRILALGDSFTFGQGVDDHEAWPAVLQRAAMSEGYAVEVVNGGWAATSPSGYLEYVQERGAGLAPDLLLIAVFVGNDVIDELLEEARGLTDAERIAFEARFRVGGPDRLAAIGRSREGTLLGALRSAADVLAPNIYDLLTLAYAKLQYAFGSHRTQFDYILREAEPSDVARGWTRMFTALEATAALASQRGHRVGVVIVPFYDQVATTPLAPDLVRDHPQRRLLRFCVEREIACLDLMPGLRAAGQPERLYFLRDGHWTRQGHNLAATEIMRWLVAQGALKH